MKYLPRVLLVATLAAVSACNATIITRTDGPYIDENGISVPVPPPSLTAEPVQFVEIAGTLGITMPKDMTTAYLFEGTSGRGYFVYADDTGNFLFKGVQLDLNDNCLEVWYEEPGKDGRSSEHSFFVASIADDDVSVLAMQWNGGC